MTKINVLYKYVIISKLGIIPKATEVDVCSIISADKKTKLRYGRMWLKRTINQAIRGSIECYIKAGKKIMELDHGVEVNDNIINLDNSINMNI